MHGFGCGGRVLRMVDWREFAITEIGSMVYRSIYAMEERQRLRGLADYHYVSMLCMGYVQHQRRCLFPDPRVVVYYLSLLEYIAPMRRGILAPASGRSLPLLVLAPGWIFRSALHRAIPALIPLHTWAFAHW